MSKFSTLWNGQKGSATYGFEFEKNDSHMIISVHADFFSDPKPADPPGYLMARDQKFVFGAILRISVVFGVRVQIPLHRGGNNTGFML